MKNYDPTQSNPVDRIALHVTCALRRHCHWRWHWQGIQREIATLLCVNSPPRLVPTQATSLSNHGNDGTARSRFRGLGSLIAMVVLLSAPVTQGADTPSQYPLMRFTPDQMQAFMNSHRSAPQLAAPPVQFNANFASSVSLLSRLPYVPAERNQGACGDCWQWAATGVMEIAHDVQNAVHDRLSIQFINSCNNSVACCNGGWLEYVTSFYQQQGFAVPWSNTGAQFASGNGSCANAPCANLSTNPRYNIQSISTVTIPTHGVGRAQAIANIKNVLNQNKAIWFGFFMWTGADWDQFFNFWNNQAETAVWPSFYCGKTPDYGQGGHAVVCVGYNDDDPNNRYWIMVNSWGPASGRPNLVFRVSMDLDYDCASANGYQSLYWQTLDIQFDSSAPPGPSAPVLAAEPAITPGTENTISWSPVMNQGGMAAASPSAAFTKSTVAPIQNQTSGIAAQGASKPAAPASTPATANAPATISPAADGSANASATLPAAEPTVVVPFSPLSDAKKQPGPGFETWQGMLSETFEGIFPAAYWTLYGNPSWNDVSYDHHNGYWSGWCAGSAMSPGDGYVNNMNSWMVYGPFSLADAASANVSFWYKNYSEQNYDYFKWMASTDGYNFYGQQISGNQSAWTAQTFDLANVYTLGNLCGQQQVWIAFMFSSDSSVCGAPYTGPFVDDIVLQKDVVPKPDLAPYQPYNWNDRIPVGTTQLAGTAAHPYSGAYYDNQTLYLNWGSLNQGTATASGYTVHVEVTGTGGGSWNWSGLSTLVNYYTYLTTDLAVGPLAAGTHTVKVWVDYAGNASELNEANNYYERTITVLPSAAPDLTPYQPGNWNDRIPIGLTASVMGDAHSYSGAFYDDQTLYFNWASINQGNAASGSYTVHVEVLGGGGMTADWTIPSDALNQWWALGSDQAVGPLSAGTHTFKVWMDYNNSVSELNEANNYYERTITVTPGLVEYYAECANNAGFASPTSSGWIMQTQFTFQNLTPGQTYWYRVKARQGGRESFWSNVELSQQELVAPVNDPFANRILLNGATVSTTGCNIGATSETGEPMHAGITCGKSVWWKWTAPADRAMNITTYGSSYDTLLAVYTGSSVSALTQVSCNDDCGGTLNSGVRFVARAGTTYQIAVDGYYGASGNVQLNIAPAAPLRLGTPRRLADGTCRIWVEIADGTPLDPNHLPAIELYATTNLKLPTSAWTRGTGTLTYSEGRAFLDDLAARTIPARYYRAVERP